MIKKKIATKPVKSTTEDNSKSKSPSTLISVDIGRSSVKAAWSLNKTTKGTLEFPLVVAKGKKFLSENTTSFSMEEETFEMFVYEDKSTPTQYLFGNSASLHGRNVKSDFSETQVFHEYAVHATLFCVGKILAKDCFKKSKSPHEVVLSINLTFDNIQSSSFYSEKIKKVHSLNIIEFGNKIPVKFSVKELYCFQQGYASIFNFLGKKNESTIFSNTGLAIDIGRHTLDISIVSNGSLFSGTSLPIGTHQLIDTIKIDSKAKGLSLTSSDIEKSFIDPKVVFRSLKSEPYYPYKTFEEKIPNYFRMVTEEILSFVGGKEISWIIVVGGFTPYLKKHLEKEFSSIPYSLVENPRFANCLGMVKFLETF